MSTFSSHHQVRAPQEDVLEVMSWMLWSEPDVIDVEVLTPAEARARGEALELGEDDELPRVWAIAPTDQGGWTALWASWGGHDEPLIRRLAAELGCDALYGHDNDQVDNWRWIRIRGGVEVDEAWFLGEAWARERGRPLPSMSLGEAFGSFGRSYEHRSFSAALAGADERWRVLRRVVRLRSGR
ncbi:MAG: hypothetical protein KC420_05620 [Myxococcales bacterium]|nr:hypothetical protein [Myxococcales bacterium]MCB9701812.1 hypothetical protein [Myxococcales bacterium]